MGKRTLRSVAIILFLAVISLVCSSINLAAGSNPVPTAGETIYRDDFSNSQTGWEVANSETYISGYKDGEYEINVTKPFRTIFNTTDKFAFKAGGYAIQAEMWVTDGKPGYYGLFFNFIKKEETWYQLLINPVTKCYQLRQKYNNNKQSWPVIDWTESSLIRDLREKNIVRLEHYNDILRIFINGEYVNQAVVRMNPDNLKAGFMAISEETAFAIHYDNFLITKINQPLELIPAADPNARFVIMEGSPGNPTDRNAIDAVSQSIGYLERLWEVRLIQPVRIFIYPTKDVYYLGLLKYRNMVHSEAEKTAGFSVALAGNFDMHINKEYLGRGGNLKYLQEVVAHETAHIFQNNQYYVGKISDSYRCLWEGYAYYSSYQATGTTSQYRKEMVTAIKYLIDNRERIPDIFAIGSLSNYINVGNQFGMLNLKSVMYAATECLIERHGGHKAFATYFAGGNNSTVKSGADAFASSFGISLPDFQNELQAYLEEIAKSRKY